MTSFRNRILILLIGLVIGAQIVTLVTALARTSATEHTRAQQQIAAGTRVAEQLLRFRERQLRSAAEVLSSDFGLREAMASSDALTVASALGNLAGRIEAQLAFALDIDGHLLTIGESSDAIDQSTATQFAQSLTTGNSSNRLMLIDGRAYQVVVSPVRAPDEIGQIVLGFALNANLAEELRRMVGVEVLFTMQTGDAAQILASTLPAIQQGGNISGLPRELNEPSQLKYVDTEYLAASLPLLNSGKAIGITLLKPMLEVRAPFRSLAETLGSIVLVTLVLAIAAGLIMGRSAVRPIQQLALGAIRVARGDYSSQVEAKGGQELAALANAFNSMQKGIADRETQILHQSRHDAATGLPNRAHLEEWLVDSVETLRPEQELVVIVFAVTNIREITAGFGFDMSERLIHRIAQLLAQKESRFRMVARIDTARFVGALILDNPRELDALVEKAYRQLSQTVESEGVQLRARVVSGVALAPLHTRKATELLRCAEVAVESALSARPRRRIGYFERGSDESQRRRIKIGAVLPADISAGQLSLVYQPKVNMTDRATISAEVLARWRHSELGDVSPAEFVNVAEDTGIASQLTRFVLENALKQLAYWQQSGLQIELAVNLSASDIVDPELVEFILDALRKVRIPAGSLILEITEGAMMTEPQRAARNMELLRVAGVRFSIDDFGTGYSSLSQLQNLAVDELKIDRSFVEAMVKDAESLAIVRSIIELAHGLDLRVVAEGIETEEQWKILSGLHCDYAQGFLISRPVPADELESFVRLTSPRLAESSTESQVLRVFRTQAGI